MAKVTTIDLSKHFNASRTNVPLRLDSGPTWHPSVAELLPMLPGGDQIFWGIPFRLGATNQRAKSFLVLDEEVHSIPLRAKASYVVFVHFCNASQDPCDQAHSPDIGPGDNLRPGEHLADYVLVYQDASEHRHAIRRGFELNHILFADRPFAARHHAEYIPLDPKEPHPGNYWGMYEVGVADKGNSAPRFWVYALENPHPEKVIHSLRLEPSGRDRIGIAGVTLYSGSEHPLRRRRLESLRVTLPQETAIEDIDVRIDLGTIARKYVVPILVPDVWLHAPVKGWGEDLGTPASSRRFIIDVIANTDATLNISGQKVVIRDVFDSGFAASKAGQVTVELLSPLKTWVKVTITDSSTGRPTPARVHFRAADGRYLPPYGHRYEVNDGWFQDYGADVKMGQTQYAYVDGTFEIELPVGEVYVEISKGFEYRPLRQRLMITPGQREVSLTIERPINMRERGWVTADTHVHFISPQTAWLEAQGEGINVVNLLASQWGAIFTNVGDITGDLSGVSREDTLVWTGQENRQGMLGHISLLGMSGSPVFPMCADGPIEGYLGDPLWSGLSEWADRCRKQGGVVVMPHFPFPYGEIVALMILDKVDAVEFKRFSPTMDDFSMHEWYRFLNTGYRVPCVGGTDKMSAAVALGIMRTYAHLRGSPLSFENWGKAVKAGRTFATNHPMIGITVNGKTLGDEIQLSSEGGILDIEAWAESILPLHTLQIVVNGQVVSREVRDEGLNRLELTTRLTVDRSSWIAARCISKHRIWKHSPKVVGAHSSPVYVVVGGEQQFCPTDAAYLGTMLDGTITWVDTLAIPAAPDRQALIREPFERAQKALQKRMKEYQDSHRN